MIALATLLLLLQDDPQAKATVLLFTRTDCPVSNRYAPEIIRIYKEFEPKGVQFLLVYPEGVSEEHRKQYGYPMPAVGDPDRKLVKRANASVTPQAAVFVKGELVYSGRIDDRYLDFGKYRPKAGKHELQDALESILKGARPPVATAKAVGCAITR